MASPTTTTNTTTSAAGNNSSSSSYGWSLYLGSCIGGIPIRLHYSYFLILILELFSGLQASGSTSKYMALLFCIYGPILFLTILVHEYGHALMTQKLGGQVQGIMLWPLGGLAFCGPTEGHVKEDLYVAIAGPATHILQVAVWVGIFAWTCHGEWDTFNRYINISELQNGGTDVFFRIVSAQSIFLNIGLVVFNLCIPAYPLDGGRCLAALLVMCGVRVPKAAYGTSILAMLLAIAMGSYGAAEYISKDSPNALFLVLICIFIFLNSYQLFKMTRAGRVYQHPLFSRPCYRETEQQQQQQGNSTTMENVAEMT
mmetsp:Transcript_14465/g.20395  ORF Transcript_14465/g.20395 Transcript_14465/m.20395 type:complete len:313 (+) Transcript_14465:249-1187(+)